jgi:hypothetical protein
MYTCVAHLSTQNGDLYCRCSNLSPPLTNQSVNKVGTKLSHVHFSNRLNCFCWTVRVNFTELDQQIKL